MGATNYPRDPHWEGCIVIGPDLGAIVAAGPEAIAHYDRVCAAFAEREYAAVERERQQAAALRAVGVVDLDP